MRTNVPPLLPVYVRLSAFADDCGAKGLSGPCQIAVDLAFTNFFCIIFLEQFFFVAPAKLSTNATAAVVNRCNIQNLLFSDLNNQNALKNLANTDFVIIIKKTIEKRK